MKLRAMMSAVAIVAMSASSAMAGFSVGPNAGPYVSDGSSGSPTFGTLAFTHNPGVSDFTPGTVSFTGTATVVPGSGSWTSELRVIVRNPAGQNCVSTQIPGTANNFTPATQTFTNFTFDCSASLTTTAGNGSGNWQVRFGESANDAGIDANWSNVSMTVNNFVPPPAPPSTQLQAGNAMASYTHAGAVQWFKYTLLQDANAGLGKYLKIHTLGSSLTGGTFGANDTHIALYNSNGQRVALNDDHGSPTLRESKLVFGDATGENVSSSGTLLAGTYYLAVSPYNLNPGTSGFATNFVPSGTPVGDIKVNFLTNAPEPGTLALLAIGAAALVRRRR